MTGTTATPAPSITLERNRWGGVDRRTVLAAFADDIDIEPVFGPDRPLVAASIAAHLRGIMPTKGDVTRHAFGYGNERRMKAYRKGREYLLSVYWGYQDPASLPAIGSDDLPED